MEITLKKGSLGSKVVYLQKIINDHYHLGLLEDAIFGESTEAAVREIQKKEGLSVDGIVGVSTWSVLQKNKIRNFLNGLPIKHSKRTIDEIVVHCTATPEGMDYPTQTIREWHLKQGWSDIGYHYIVHLDGTIDIGRDVDKAGAHVQNHNLHSIGVVYVGGCKTDGKTPKDTRTPEQKEALFKLLRKLHLEYPQATIYGHRDFAAKACPCFDAYNEYKSILHDGMDKLKTTE